MATEVPATPNHSTSTSTTTPSITELLQHLQDGFNDDPSGKKRKCVHLTADQFPVLMHCFEKQQNDISALLSNKAASPSHSSSNHTNNGTTTPENHHPKPSDHYNNAKYEDIVC